MSTDLPIEDQPAEGITLSATITFPEGASELDIHHGNGMNVSLASDFPIELAVGPLLQLAASIAEQDIREQLDADIEKSKLTTAPPEVALASMAKMNAKLQLIHILLHSDAEIESAHSAAIAL